jgi:hypothetical protein
MTKKIKSQKKDFKFIKWLAIIGIIIIIFLGAGVMLLNPPAKNLGVSWNEEDAQSANLKLGRIREPLPETDVTRESVKYEGSHPVEESLTSEELTATLNTRDYKYNPMKKVQIKVNDDGTIEASGTIILANIIPYTEAFGIKNEKVKETIAKYGEKLPINPNFYYKGTPTISNNNANVKIEEIKIGAFDVGEQFPNNILNDAVNEQIEGVPGLNVDNLEVTNGKLDFKGDYPDKSMYVPN